MTAISNTVCTLSVRAAALALATACWPMIACAQEGAPPDVDRPEIAALAADVEPPVFASPEAALDGFRQALKTEGSDAVAVLLGLDPERLRADQNTIDSLEAMRQGAAKQLVLEGEGDRRTVVIGEKLWPLPFPIVKDEDGKWAFDTFDGLAEIINRRVGENELVTIETMRAYVDAQEEYASQDRDDDGVNEYAQKLVSTEGNTDGIYWPTDEVHGQSPAGDLSQSELDDAAKGEGYFGYKYRILTGQGDQIAGGAYDYVINGNMIGGFGLVAWPAKYGETGVKTFAVNQAGVVYETDLGPSTSVIVKYIDRFNPDQDWTVVSD